MSGEIEFKNDVVVDEELEINGYLEVTTLCTPISLAPTSSPTSSPTLPCRKFFD
jgi:hypothetical protein